MSIESDLFPKEQISNTQFTCIPKINVALVYKKATFRYKVIRGKNLTSYFLKTRIASSSNAVTATFSAFTEKQN